MASVRCRGQNSVCSPSCARGCRFAGGLFARAREPCHPDRRVHGGGNDYDAGAFSGAAPRYGDFAVYGNVVLLCEGPFSGAALENCGLLIGAVLGEESG